MYILCTASLSSDWYRNKENCNKSSTQFRLEKHDPYERFKPSRWFKPVKHITVATQTTLGSCNFFNAGKNVHFRESWPSFRTITLVTWMWLFFFTERDIPPPKFLNFLPNCLLYKWAENGFEKMTNVICCRPWKKFISLTVLCPHNACQW